MERSVSMWSTTATVPRQEPLREDLDVDICVVGAGIAGLTTAYLLAAEGRSVVVLDDGPIGGGQTCRTTAHLANAIDDRYYELERIHGTDVTRLAAASHTSAIDCIEKLVGELRIDCDYERVDGFLSAGPDHTPEILVRERDATWRAGLFDVELVTSLLGPALRFPRQAQLHPLRYLAGLAAGLQARSGRIYTGTHALRIHGGMPARVETDLQVVRADAIVVATNVPVNNLLIPHLKQAPYMSYVIAAPIPNGAVPKALYWDTADPYHYVRTHVIPGPAAGRAITYLIVGGEDHKSGQADDSAERFTRLRAWATARFPGVGPVELEWSGQVMETLDGLAFIGRNPLDDANVYIATGDSGMGMTHGTIAGMLLTDLITGRPNAWAAIYDPARKPTRALRESLREDVNMAAQYASWVTPGEIASLEQLPRDSGAVMRRGLVKLAVYRDERGSLHECSATCPHLGCHVHWNSAEKTWDCPCHGSRFDRFGRVINGPANKDLTPLTHEQNRQSA